MNFLRKNAIALVALFIALGGTSYAVIQLPANSVGSKQIRAGAVTGEKVRDGSLGAADFAAGQLPQGPRGDQGPQGPQGPPGVNGIHGLKVRIGAETVIAGGAAARGGTATVSCQAGEIAISGGGIAGSTGSDPNIYFYGSQGTLDGTPVTDGQTPNGWRVDAWNPNDSARGIIAEAMCVPAG